MKRPHRPPHITDAPGWYHIAAATLDKRRLLAGEERMGLFRELLKEKTVKFGVITRAWVTLDNHYHLLCRFQQADVLPEFIRELHGASAFQLNRLDHQTGRAVWQNYWDRCIRDEQELWTLFNYIHQNPVKHGHTAQMGDWPFSSYNFWLKKRGEQWMTDCLSRYPVVDFVAYSD